MNSADVAGFRSAFGLPASPLAIVVNGSDPGLTSDQAEATLAASWAGAAAPGAQILLAPAAATSATDGADLSLAAIVDQRLANVVAVGYSACEAALSPAHQAFYSALYQQAAAEGISVIAASGDSGAAACTAAGGAAPVSTGLAVNALASTPWNTVVGVAGYAAGGAAAGSSALTAWSPVNAADPAYASGGGISTLYARPGWQPIPAQLAADGTTVTQNRLLPDLVLPTAIDSGFNPGLAFCLSGSTAPSGCTLVRSGGNGVASAIFAGIVALIDQKYGAQGNLAPSLYALSRADGVFNDVQQGTAQLPCVAGTPGCGATQEIGFTASSGYDLATGLGTVNANVLVSLFATPQQTGSGTVIVNNLIAPNQTINPSGSLYLSASVVSSTGPPAPTGIVTFYDLTTGTDLSNVYLVAGSGVTSTASATVTGVLGQGTHSIVVVYGGDSNYAPASSTDVTVNVQPTATTTTVAASPPPPLPAAPSRSSPPSPHPALAPALCLPPGPSPLRSAASAKAQRRSSPDHPPPPPLP